MKKNRFVKIASALVMMCLITTCAIGSTFAKYTTGSDAADTARVAKWGVEASISGTMFGKAYGAHSAVQFKDSIAAETQASVNTSTADKVVAPGTKNETGIQIKIKGQPEVAFDVNATGADVQDIFLAANEYGVMVEAHGVNAYTDYAAEGIYYKSGVNYIPVDFAYWSAHTNGTYYKLTNYVDLDETYYPIVWKGTIVAVNTNGVGSGEQTFTTLAAAVEALVGGINALPEYAANDNIDLTYTLTWAWAFNGQNDGADTILGDLQAGRTVVKLSGSNYVPLVAADYNLEVAASIGVTATQID